MGTALPQLWIITNPEHPEGAVAPVIRALDHCPRGAVGVQLRATDAADRDLVAWGRALRTATAERDCPLTISRRPDVMEIVGADGVHLPEAGLSVEEVRSEWPDIPLIGVSRHDRSGLLRAARDGATFGFLSPIFPVPGKSEPMGIDGFATEITSVGMPTYALGGVGVPHVRSLIGAGAHGVAVRRAIYDAPDPRAALQALLGELDKTAPNGE